MNKNIMEGKWNQIKGKVKQSFAEFGDTDLALLAEGKKDEFVGLAQERLGETQESIEERLSNTGYDDYHKECGCGSKH